MIVECEKHISTRKTNLYLKAHIFWLGGATFASLFFLFAKTESIYYVSEMESVFVWMPPARWINGILEVATLMCNR